MNGSYHPFKSEKAKEKYLAYYDNHAKTWPVSSKNKYFETSYGQTFVRISGAEDKPALILLHGDSENSLSWKFQIDEFSKHYKTYAIDHVFDNGRSIYSRPLEKADDFVNWLNELFDSLGLENNINLLGFSYGGWQTGIYALSNPYRLNKIILISPAATVLPARIEYLIRAILPHFIPHRYFIKKQIYWERSGLIKQGKAGRIIADQMVEELLLAKKCFKNRKFVIPTVLKDKDWQNIKIPVLFLVGGDEVLYSPQKAVERLNSVARHVQAEIVPGASHDITLSQPELVNKKVLDFLGDNK